MDRPWFQLWTRDWLDNKELRRCSGSTRAQLLDLMCLANEGKPYGFLADSVGPLLDKYMAMRCCVSARQFKRGMDELLAAGRIKQEGNVFFIPRMVRDEEIRMARAAGGIKGGNPALMVDQKVNLTSEVKVRAISRARMRADSDSSFDSVSKILPEKKENDADEVCALLIARHPKTGDATLAEHAFVEVLGQPNADMAKIATAHALWCSHWTEERTKTAYIPKLSNWLRDGAWRQKPPPRAKTAIELAMDMMEEA